MAGSASQVFESPTRGNLSPQRANGETVAIVVAVVLTLFAGLWLSAFEVERIDQLTVTNRSDYDIQVMAGTSPLADVEANTGRNYRNVIDQGEQWVFTFESQGTFAGSVEIDRSTLIAQNWTVQVPSSAAETLRASRVQPAIQSDR